MRTASISCRLAAFTTACLCATVAYGDGPGAVADEMKRLVSSSLEGYRQLEQDIAAQKSPLVARLNELEQGNLKLRAEVDSYRFITEQARSEAAALSEDLKSLTAQSEYISSTFDDFLAKFESRINVAETQRYLGSLTDTREIAQSETTSLNDRLQAYASALRLSLERSGGAVGGYRFEGRAVDARGRYYDGSIAALGPSSYFLDTGSGRAGILQFSAGTIEPGVAFLDGDEGERLAEFIRSGAGEVPFDASLGDALSLRATRGDVLAHVRQGGFVGYAILLLGLVAVVLSALKLRDLSGFATAAPETLAELAQVARERGSEAAADKARSIGGIASDMLVVGVRNINKNALLLEETMLSVILRAKPKMERYLPFLAITAAAAPLLGLLGTVVGLIKTFALITLHGSGAPKALSSGISEALVTTELGLVIAIPALILHGLFSRVIRTRLGVLEQTAFDFVETVSIQQTDRNA